MLEDFNFADWTLRKTCHSIRCINVIPSQPNFLAHFKVLNCIQDHWALAIFFCGRIHVGKDCILFFISIFVKHFMRLILVNGKSSKILCVTTAIRAKSGAEFAWMKFYSFKSG